MGVGGPNLCPCWRNLIIWWFPSLCIEVSVNFGLDTFPPRRHSKVRNCKFQRSISNKSNLQELQSCSRHAYDYIYAWIFTLVPMDVARVTHVLLPIWRKEILIYEQTKKKRKEKKHFFLFKKEKKRKYFLDRSLYAVITFNYLS